jgi:hypothetical protein
VKTRVRPHPHQVYLNVSQATFDGVLSYSALKKTPQTLNPTRKIFIKMSSLRMFKEMLFVVILLVFVCFHCGVSPSMSI